MDVFIVFELVDSINILGDPGAASLFEGQKSPWELGGAGKSLNGREKIGRRKVKNERKSP